MSSLTHRLDRRLVIRAHPDTVFGFFTDSARWAAWWGAGSEIDARPGGRMYIRHPNGHEVFGEVLDVRAPERLVFTYDPGAARPKDQTTSRVTIAVAPHAEGTLLSLTHEFAEAAARDAHVQGWRFQLSIFANLVATGVTASAASIVDRWNSAWNEPDDARRNETLAGLVAPGIRFADRYSAIDGLDELRAHLAAVHRFMPGVRLERRGDVRHCQWRILADWTATGPDGGPRGAGTNLFELDADGRIGGVTGFWAG
jgi:uncharacterized protein YndB with AHSA1/START domain